MTEFQEGQYAAYTDCVQHMRFGLDMLSADMRSLAEIMADAIEEKANALKMDDEPPPVDNDHVAEGCQRFGLNLDKNRKPILGVVE
jgi:hypothetical protein